MTTATADQSVEFAPSGLPSFPDDHAQLLDRLRQIALTSRCARRMDVDLACPRPAAHGVDAPTECGQALMCSLGNMTGRRLVVNRPGAVDITFDEAWLMRVILSYRSQDWDSLTFLIQSRIPRPYRRRVISLVQVSANICA